MHFVERRIHEAPLPLPWSMVALASAKNTKEMGWTVDFPEKEGERR